MLNIIVCVYILQCICQHYGKSQIKQHFYKYFKLCPAVTTLYSLQDTNRILRTIFVSFHAELVGPNDPIHFFKCDVANSRSQVDHLNFKFLLTFWASQMLDNFAATNANQVTTNHLKAYCLLL